MPLPNPGMSFTPLDPLPASDLNDMVENIESLADGSGFDAGAIDTAAIASSAVTSEKLTTTIACRAFLNSAHNLTTSSVKVPLNAESFDTGSDFDTTNNRFTAPVTGYYEVSANLRVSNLADGNQIILELYVNGSTYLVATSVSASAANDPSVNISSLVYAEAGQYIELYGSASTTIALVASAFGTFMSIHFVGA